MDGQPVEVSLLDRAAGEWCFRFEVRGRGAVGEQTRLQGCPLGVRLLCCMVAAENPIACSSSSSSRPQVWHTRMLAHMEANAERIKAQRAARALRLAAAADAAEADAADAAAGAARGGGRRARASSGSGGAPKAASRLARLWDALGYHSAAVPQNAL
jgi:hypothetical protein